MTLETWILAASLLVILIASMWMIRPLLAQYVRRWIRREAMFTPAPAMDPECECTRPRVIVSPSKHTDLNVFRVQAEKTATEMGVSQIQWCETSIEDPDTGQALRMAALGAPLVIAVGGDGIVRTVATGLAGTGVRMGVIPVRTGNLLARNLELPIDDVPAAVWVVLDNEHRLMDCGWLRVDGVEEPSSFPAEGMLVQAARTRLRVDEGVELSEPESPLSTNEYSFVVISGLGFDGETMTRTNSELKKRVSWVAYVIAVLSAMTTARTRMRVIPRHPRPSDNPVGDTPTAPSSSGAVVASAIPEGEELSDAPEQEMAWIESKSLMFTNYGGLPYVILAPGVRPDDGLLDVIVVDTQAGLPGWADLSQEILFQRSDLKTFNLVNSTDQIHSCQVEGVPARAHTSQTVQVGGDLVGTAMTVHVRIGQGIPDVSVSKVL